MRLFALEYFRQFGNVDVLHFSGKGKKAQLKVKTNLATLSITKGRKDGKKQIECLESLGLANQFPMETL
jgi:hypothetical protein